MAVLQCIVTIETLGNHLLNHGRDKFEDNWFLHWLQEMYMFMGQDDKCLDKEQCKVFDCSTITNAPHYDDMFVAGNLINFWRIIFKNVKTQLPDLCSTLFSVTVEKYE